MKTSTKISESSDIEKDDIEKDYDIILDNFELTICIICGREVESYWESKYKGVRASCSNCEINWAES
jgi:hypothetical protein